MNCKYHTDRKATRVFKAHAPGTDNIVEYIEGVAYIDQDAFDANTKLAHFYNLFLCEECCQPVVSLGAADTGERYGRVRFVRAVTDKLPDSWEKVWQYLYCMENGEHREHVFAEPAAVVYYVNLNRKE